MPSPPGLCYLGIDSGLTVTKAAVFGPDGHCLSAAAVPSTHTTLPGGLVETDPERQWRDVAAATRAALRGAGGAAGAVRAVGVTSHGDCVYLVGSDGLPVRPAIPSLDFRGAAIADRWARDGVSERLLAIIGEIPHPHHIHATLRWLADEEPASLRGARWLLFAKDWLKLRLTGTVGTDPTDATAGFVDLRTGAYSDEALAVCGLDQLAGMLPPIQPPTGIAGTVSPQAAALTGLPAGVPVACGVHDITAAALGSGLADTSTALVVGGTYSVNAVLVDRPVPDRRWLCRHWAEPGRWIHMSTSATSASNLAWLVEHLGLAPAGEGDPYAALNREVAEVIDEDLALVFHPFLFGTPADARACASVLGLRPWHRRAHVYRAVLEGIAFSHRTHTDALWECATPARVLLTGGAANSELWSQMFADVLGLPVAVPAAGEAGALGAAMCAAVAAGEHDSLSSAVRAMTRTRRSHVPDPARRERTEAAYRRFTQTVEAAKAIWAALTTGAG
jgi:L-xylulokinase